MAKRTRSIGLTRQTHMVAATIMLASWILMKTVDPNWIYLTLLPTFGLTLDSLTGFCPMTLLLSKAPWNR